MPFNTAKSDDYALDEFIAIQHVVTALARASDALAISDIAKNYNHAFGDISRVKHHQKLSTDNEAKEWLVEWAITQLGRRQVEEINGTYKLKKPVDKIRWNEEKIHLIEEAEEIWPGGNTPFDNFSEKGIFHKNIRHPRERDSDTELRASMQEFGWVEQFPALVDEYGFVLVGHRRLQIAGELGIEPVTQKINIGKGAEANAERLKIAIVSNIGFQPMSTQSRKRIAVYLYNDLEWTMEKIGEALNVVNSTISKDLKGKKKPRSSAGRTRKDSKGRNNPGRPPKNETRPTDEPEVEQPEPETTSEPKVYTEDPLPPIEAEPPPKEEVTEEIIKKEEHEHIWIQICQTEIRRIFHDLQLLCPEGTELKGLMEYYEENGIPTCRYSNAK